jgi:putative salt-induced outer membrane protein YdiY
MSASPFLRRAAGALLAALLAAPRLSADVVTTRDGSRLVGRVTKIDADLVYLTTAYAGDLVIKQGEVASIETDTPVSVRLKAGSRTTGRITTVRPGAVQVAGPNGTLTTSVADVAAVWPAGGMDPALAALQRHWKYEATVDIDGTAGNQNQLGSQASFTAKLVTPQDALILSTAYNRQVTNGVKSADQYKAGVDYSDNYVDGDSWYVRDEGGFDRIMGIKFYDTAAAGYGYDLIKNAFDTLTGRAGLGYRYDGYESAMTPAVSSATADFEIDHDLKLRHSELVDKLTADPALDDFSNLTVTQDSYYQIPLANPAWKLRLGVSNNYNSRPGPGLQKLDTDYYTRLILDWQ